MQLVHYSDPKGILLKNYITTTEKLLHFLIKIPSLLISWYRCQINDVVTIVSVSG